ncbi:CPCC family cysteine-rich protein [Sorangium atrum]|uniref:CPCC family cysteine-rich protein n=1 Tax=Sorangium atrum TaxID=2995308 RepID=UPI00358DD251
MTQSELYECPCCGQRTLDGRGHYDICATCNWEDDPLQEEKPYYEGGANRVSLNTARRNFALHGTSDPGQYGPGQSRPR